MPGGRPSDYDPRFCDEIIEFMGQGYSITAFAGHIGVHRDTLYEWESKHPAFSDAIKAARMMRVAALEYGLLNASAGHEVTARIFALKNADPTEWRDKRDVDVTSKGKSMALDWSKVPTEALEAMRAAMTGDSDD